MDSSIHIKYIAYYGEPFRVRDTEELTRADAWILINDPPADLIQVEKQTIIGRALPGEDDNVIHSEILFVQYYEGGI